MANKKKELEEVEERVEKTTEEIEGEKIKDEKVNNRQSI